MAPAHIVQTVWHELFWSCRRTWLGLAAVWLLILIVNLTSTDTAATPAAAVAAIEPQQLRTLLREQSALRAELSDSLSPLVPDAPPRDATRPRSDRALAQAAV